MADTAIVLQARMGSSRLPGKSLARIAGASLLAHCIERLGAESGLPVIVATTTSPLDDAIQEEAGRMGAAVVRGPEDDVLSRYVLAADRFDLVHLVRATADNPVVDLGAPVRAAMRAFRLPVRAAVRAIGFLCRHAVGDPSLWRHYRAAHEHAASKRTTLWLTAAVGRQRSRSRCERFSTRR